MAQARHTQDGDRTEDRPRSRLDGHRAILWILAEQSSLSAKAAAKQATDALNTVIANDKTAATAALEAARVQAKQAAAEAKKAFDAAEAALRPPPPSKG